MNTPEDSSPSRAEDNQLYFDCHVFCCTNERAENHTRGSCARKGSVELRDYMKSRAKALGLKRTRINSSGCLDRCELGPTVVIYPDGIWYRAESTADVDEILTSHLQNGVPVERLILKVDA